jgi:hypothetical protein
MLKARPPLKMRTLKQIRMYYQIAVARFGGKITWSQISEKEFQNKRELHIKNRLIKWKKHRKRLRAASDLKAQLDAKRLRDVQAEQQRLEYEDAKRRKLAGLEDHPGESHGEK